MGHRWETPGDFPESCATKTVGTGMTIIPAGIVNDSNGEDTYPQAGPPDMAACGSSRPRAAVSPANRRRGWFGPRRTEEKANYFVRRGQVTRFVHL